jgi:alpha-tubulin suppressor-like RCC1 family protein
MAEVTAGILSNGTLWMWGVNNYGQLGLNTSTSSF